MDLMLRLCVDPYHTAPWLWCSSCGGRAVNPGLMGSDRMILLWRLCISLLLRSYSSEQRVWVATGGSLVFRLSGCYVHMFMYLVSLHQRDLSALLDLLSAGSDVDGTPNREREDDVHSGTV